MKTLSLAASAALAKQLGEEPIVLVQIEIPDNFVYVADRDISRANISWKGKITSLGNITEEQTIDLVGNVSSVAISLDDSDEVFRQRLNTERWPYQPVKVFHTFDTLNEIFLIMSGKVATPFDWKEEGHSLSFEIVSDVISQQAGIEVDDTEYASAVNGGYAPLAFGTINNACLSKVYEDISATLATELILDKKVYYINEQDVQKYGTWQKSPFFATYGDYYTRVSGFYIVLVVKPPTSFQVDDASRFPQNTSITLVIDNLFGKITGSFANNTFTISEYSDILGMLKVTDFVGKNVVGETPIYVELKDYKDYTFTTFVYTFLNSDSEPQKVNVYVLSQDGKKVYLSSQPPEIWTKIEVHSGDFFISGGITTDIITVAKVGQKVFLDALGYIEAYAFTAIPYTDLEVLGYQIFNGKKLLCKLPPEFYNIITNYMGLGFDAITLPKLLSAYKSDINPINFHLSWGSDIYVSFKSSVGSNVSDIIAYIITHYTNLVIDSASFAAVKTQVAKYPANFVVKGAPDALQLISEICYQSRCAIFIRNGIVYIKYISLEPATTALVTDNDIEEGSMEVGYTDDSQIKTNLRAKFLEDCVYHVEKFDLFRANVNIYGLIKEEKEYFIYNILSLIKKSNTFWGNRITNQWKIIKFKTFLSTLQVDQGDCIEVNTNIYTGKAIVTNVSYDSGSFSVAYTCWTPVIAGTNVQSPIAWQTDTGDPVIANPVIVAADPVVYSASYINSYDGYGVHDRETLIANVVSDEDPDGLIPFTDDNGNTGVATNLNTSAPFKAGDRTVVTKGLDGKYYATSPGGGGSSPVTITAVDDTGSFATIDVYAKGYSNPATQTGLIGVLITPNASLTVPRNAMGTLTQGVYLIDVSTSGLVAGGSTDTPVTDGFGTSPEDTGTLGDLVRVSSDGYATLNLDEARLSSGGGSGTTLDHLVTILNNFLCIKYDAPLTEGVTTTSTLADFFSIDPSGKLALNLESAKANTLGGVGVLINTLIQIVAQKLCLKLAAALTDGTDTGVLSDVFTIKSGKLCLKTTAQFSDGTTAAPAEWFLDGSVFRPATTMLKD